MLGLLLATTLASQPGPALPGRGVSEALARERAAIIRGLRYELTFAIPAGRDPVQGRAILRFQLTQRTPVVLDFAQPRDHLLALRSGDADLPLSFEDEHIVIPAS